MSLRLHESAHDAVGGEEDLTPIPSPRRKGGLCHYCWNDRVIWALVGREGVGMVRVEAEVMPAVLQGEAKALRHDAGPKTPVIAVDEGTGVAELIHHTEI